MIFNHFVLIATFVASFLSAQESYQESTQEDGKGCRPRRSSSSSHRRCSSSSSSSSSCGSHDSYAKVKHLQATWEARIKTCDYNGAAALASPRFSYSLIEAGCMPRTCCHREGNMNQFLGTYSCADRIFNYSPTLDNIRQYHNGTVVVQRAQAVIVAVSNVTVVHTYNYHWTPMHGCKFQLTYIDGNELSCPNYIYQLPACVLC